MQICVDCGVHAPDTNTNYTLISAQHGWRVTRQPNGAPEWHCPACWRKLKQARAAARKPSPSIPPGPGENGSSGRH